MPSNVWRVTTRDEGAPCEYRNNFSDLRVVRSLTCWHIRRGDNTFVRGAGIQALRYKTAKAAMKAVDDGRAL